MSLHVVAVEKRLASTGRWCFDTVCKPFQLPLQKHIPSSSLNPRILWWPTENPAFSRRRPKLAWPQRPWGSWLPVRSCHPPPLSPGITTGLTPTAPKKKRYPESFFFCNWLYFFFCCSCCCFSFFSFFCSCSYLFFYFFFLLFFFTYLIFFCSASIFRNSRFKRKL